MANQPKQWKSFEAQLEIIKQRGMSVRDEVRALDFLKRVGYYRLSGYFHPFRQSDQDAEGNYFRKDEFIESSQFDDVIDLYLFDRKLRLLALDAIERIELAVQVDIAHLLGRRDIHAHENPQILHPYFTTKQGRDGKTQYEHWQADYAKLVRRANRKEFVRHNLEKYGQLPIWVAVEVWDFGALSKFYSGMKVRDKISIEAKFGLNEGKHLQTWLRALNFVRNVSAHHSRLWNCNMLERASIPSNKIHLRNLENSRPFVYFCIMKQMLDVICPESKWGSRFIALIDQFPEVANGAVLPEHMGAINGWREWDMWQ